MMSSIKFTNIKYLALAFFIAISLWYIVIGREQGEISKEVRLEYTNIPNGLVIRDGLKPSFTVRMHGSKELLRNVQNREVVYALDLSELKKGANAIDIEWDNLPEFRAFQAISIMPPRIILEVEELSTKILPVDINFPELASTSLYTITNVKVTPENVVIRGANSLVDQVKELVINVPVEDKAGTYSSSYAVSVPERVDASPPVVNVRYDLAAKQTTIYIQKLVQLNVESPWLYQINPSSVQLRLEVPVEFADNQELLSQVTVQAVLDKAATDYTTPNGVDAQIEVSGPKNVKIINTSPNIVNIKLRPQKNTEEKP